MEKQARMVLAGTAVVLSCMLVWAWSARVPEPVKVETAQAVSQDIYNSISVPGTVEAAESVAISPTRTAEVSEVFVQLGATVKSGAPLFALSDAAAPASGVDLSGLRQAFSAVTSGDTAKQASEDQQGIVCAVSDGTVLSLPQAGQTVYENVPCARVADLSHLRIRVRVPEMYADTLKQGQRANVKATAVGEEIYAAAVQSVAPVAVRSVSLTGESGSAEVEAVLRLRGATGGLKPGYSVTAKIFTDYRANAVVVPYTAVCQQGTQEYVFTIENGVAHKQAVTTGYLLEKSTEIVDGLAPDSLVVLSPPETLDEGERVEASA